MDEWAAALVLDRLGGQLDRKDEFIFFYGKMSASQKQKNNKKKKNGGVSNEAQRSLYRCSVSIDARKHNHQRLQ